MDESTRSRRAPMSDVDESDIQLPSWVPRPITRFLQLGFPRALTRLYARISTTDVMGLAGEMAYRFLFALFPFIIFVVAFVGFIGAKIGSSDLVSRVMALMALAFPEPVQEVLRDWGSQVLQTQSTGLLTFGAIGALIGATGGIGTLIKGLNRAYGVKETRPYWARYGMALLVTIVFTLVMLGGVAAFTIGELIVRWAVDHLGVDPEIWFWWNLIRGPGVAVGLAVVFMVIYGALPNRRLGIRHTWPGASLATLAWLVLTAGFGFYVTHIGSFDRTFGSLGAAVMLMVWMYAVGVIMLVGGHVNAMLGGVKRVTPAESERGDCTASAA